MAFGLMRLLKTFMLKQGWKSAGGDEDAREVGQDMAQALRGRLGRDARYLGTMVKYVSIFFSLSRYLYICYQLIHTLAGNYPPQSYAPCSTKCTLGSMACSGRSAGSRKKFGPRSSQRLSR